MKLRNSASCWLLLYEYITMLGPQNVNTYIRSGLQGMTNAQSPEYP